MTKQRTNEEIIIEELGNLSDKLNQVEEWEEDDLIKDFATSLLAKLNKLDRENVTKIVHNLFHADPQMCEITPDDTIDQILSLAPEEGKVEKLLKENKELRDSIEEYLEKNIATDEKLEELSQKVKKAIREEGEVIAEGKIRFIGGNIYIDNDNEWEWTTKLSVILEDKYKDKNIQIIIKEVKE